MVCSQGDTMVKMSKKERIERKQFTRYDQEVLHPECNNPEYLEYEKLGNEVIKFGYFAQQEGSTSYRWIPLREALSNKGGLEE